MYNQRALETQLAHTGKDHVYVATYYAHVGSSYHLLDIYDSAVHYHQKALSGYEKHLGKDHYYVTISQSALGDVYYDQGDYFTAQSYYQQVLKATLSLFGSQHPSLADCYNSLGNTQSRLGDNVRAARNYHKALKISQVVGDEDVQYLYNNLGDLHADGGQYDSALWYGREALATGKRVRGADHLSLATLYNTLGETFHKQLTYDSALWYYERALNIWNNHRVIQHADLALLYEKLGDVYYALDDCERALANYQNSLTANTIDSEHQARLGLRQYISSEMLLSTVGAQAQALRKRYKQTGDTFQLEQAFGAYLRYDSLITQIQASRYRQDDQLFAQRTAKKVYEDALSTGMLLYQVTQDSAYWHRMFQLAEQSRTLALRRALASYEAKKFSGIPVEVIQQEQTLKLKKAQYQTLLQKSQEANDTAQVQRCQAILLALDQRYDSLTRKVEKDYPQYHQLKYQSTAITVAELQNKLDENTTMLAYFLGEDAGYIFAITPQSFRVTSFVCDTTLTEQVKQLRAAIAPRADETSYQALTTAARALYQKLLPPITLESSSPNAARQLLVIPDGQLSQLPFELLLTEVPSAGNRRLSVATVPYSSVQRELQLLGQLAV